MRPLQDPGVPDVALCELVKFLGYSSPGGETLQDPYIPNVASCELSPELRLDYLIEFSCIIPIFLETFVTVTTQKRHGPQIIDPICG